MKVIVKFEGKCSRHPRFSPEKDERPIKDCKGCERVYSLWLYSRVVKKLAGTAHLEGVSVKRADVT